MRKLGIVDFENENRQQPVILRGTHPTNCHLEPSEICGCFQAGENQKRAVDAFPVKSSAGISYYRAKLPGRAALEHRTVKNLVLLLARRANASHRAAQQHGHT